LRGGGKGHRETAMRSEARHWAGVIFLGMVFCCVCGGQAAYLETPDDRARPATVQPRPLPPVPRPGPVPPDDPGCAVRALLRKVRVEAPYTHENLTVFPLTLDAPDRRYDVRTLAEAVRRGWIEVRELGRAQVPELCVRNDGDSHVFIMAGELLTGGRQNRMVRDDVLLSPHSDEVVVPVYCVEKGRWSGPRDVFSEAPGLVHPELRSRVLRGASQESVWGEVEAHSRRLGIRSETADYQHVYEDSRVRDRVDRIWPRFRRVCRRGRVGAVILCGSRILGCELFSSDRLFAELWDRIWRSYALDYIARPHWHGGRPDAFEVRRFLEQAAAARLTLEPSPGVGDKLRLSRGCDGHALVWRDGVVHMGFYPEPYRLYEPRFE